MRISSVNNYYHVNNVVKYPEVKSKKDFSVAQHVSFGDKYYQYLFPQIVKSTVTTYQPAKLERGQFVNKYGSLFNRHSTDFFRSDLRWKEFGQYIKSKFKDIGNVDIKVYACSTGDEAYSMAMLLSRLYEGQTFSIEAKDIARDIINTNKVEQRRGGVSIDSSRLEQFADLLGFENAEEINKFLSKTNTYHEYYKIFLSNEIINRVKFSQANILEDIKNIDSKKPSIIMCRNMWPYVNHKEYEPYAKKLYEKLAPGSVVVIGGYDWHGEVDVYKSDMFPNALKKYGFTPISVLSGKQVGNNVVSFVYEKNY